MKTVVYCGVGSIANIGNAFVDYGIWGIFKQALPEFNIVTTSNTPSWLYNKYYSLFKSFIPAHWKAKNPRIDLRQMFETDYFCIGGAFLTKEMFEYNNSFFDYLIKTKAKLLMVGISGGNNYSSKNVAYVKNILSKLNIEVFISRDEKTFENYKEFAKHSYNGIDNALFMNDYFKPAVLKNKQEYNVFAFDDMKEPIINSNKEVIRLQHDTWQVGRLKHAIKYRTNLVTKNDLLSDWADDYLNIYANCNATYADRVHACIATLVYGNKARYFGRSPRSYLFERIGLQDIKDKLVQLDFDYINCEKEKEIEFLNTYLG